MPKKRIGRKPDRTPLPPINQRLADAIQQYLMTHYDMKRPPEVAAQVLALVIECHNRQQPFPKRLRVAEKLGLTGPFGIDSALNTALARDLINEEWYIDTGEVHNRKSVVRHRHYVPSAELLHLASRVQRNAA
jgi:hypothetical protein